MIKDTNFYDTASTTYSDSRYPLVPRSYTQFFFTKRLSLIIKMLSVSLMGESGLSLLEVGCADGVVIDKIYGNFPSLFVSLVGIDTSPKMIDVATHKYSGKPFTFKVRGDYSDVSLKDVIIEVGVINYADLIEELEFASLHVKDDGVYIISLAGTDSLWNRIKKGDKGFRNFLSYREYEAEIREKFEIVHMASVGFFIPFIWKFPSCARMIQPLEAIVRPIFPNLFHEKIYLLKKK